MTNWEVFIDMKRFFVISILVLFMVSCAMDKNSTIGPMGPERIASPGASSSTRSLRAGTVEDDVYSNAWNADEDGASKNSIYDYLHLLDTDDDGDVDNLDSSIVDDDDGVDGVYAAGWNGDTDSPEKDDIYDYLHQIDTDDDGDVDSLDGTQTLNKVTLNNTSEPALTISQTSISGTDNQAIDITGGEALGGDEDWTGVRVKPDDLDPSAAGAKIRGIAVNLSGVDTTNSPDLEGARIVMPEHETALHVVEGRVLFDKDAGSAASATYTGISMNLDASNLDSSSTLRALDVASIGSTSGTIVALCAKPGVAPVCQQTGAFATPSQTEYAARYPDGGAWTDGIDGNDIFVDADDAIYIGSATTFNELEVLLSSVGTKTIFPQFYYYDTSPAWVQFYPSDGTQGFTTSGEIVWNSANLTNWKSDADPGGADGSSGYWIRIVRNRVASPGTITATTIKTLEATRYGWDTDGNLTISGVNDFVETCPIPISYMTDGASPPDALETITSNTKSVDVRTFAADSDEDLAFTWEAPPDLDVTAGIKFRVICWVYNATGPSAESWQFEMQGFSLGDGDSLDGTYGTAQTSNSGSRTDAQYDRVATAWSSAMTSTHITDLTAGETIHFKLYRDEDDNDDYGQVVGASLVMLKFKLDKRTSDF